MTKHTTESLKGTEIFICMGESRPYAVFLSESEALEFCHEYNTKNFDSLYYHSAIIGEPMSLKGKTFRGIDWQSLGRCYKQAIKE